MDGLTVVILNYNGGKILRECLDAVLAQKLPTEHEILVIDNGSTDGSGETAKVLYPKIRLVTSDNKYGFITGVNESFKHAKYNVVFFLSYDVILNKQDKNAESVIYSTMRNFFSDSSLKAIVQPVIYDRGGYIQNAGQKWLWPGYGITSKKIKHEIDMFTTTAFLMSKDSFNLIGEFDNQFSPAYYENIDYGLRAKKLGFRFFCTPFIRARHYTSMAFSKKYNGKRIREFYQINRKKIIRKHYTGISRLTRLLTINILDFFRNLAV